MRYFLQLQCSSRNIIWSVWNFRESKRKFTELEGKLREDLLMAKIRDTENSQCVAELTQKISNLEFKVREETGVKCPSFAS